MPPDVRFLARRGVITPREMADLHQYGISRIYSPEDGTSLGLDGIIGHMLKESDFVYEDWAGRDTSKKSVG